MKFVNEKWSESCSVVSNSLWPHGLWPARLLCPWDFPGKNGAVDCHFLLQGIFLTQGLNPHLLRWQRDALPLGQQGSPVLYSRWLLVIYFTYTSVYVSIPLSQIIFRSLLSPLVSLFSTSVTLFLFRKSVHLYLFKIPHIRDIQYLSFSAWLTSLSMTISRSISCCKWHYFILFLSKLRCILPPGSSVHRILQARILEWAVIPFSRWFPWPRDQTWVSHIAGRFFHCLSYQGSPDMPHVFFIHPSVVDI